MFVDKEFGLVHTIDVRGVGVMMDRGHTRECARNYFLAGEQRKRNPKGQNCLCGVNEREFREARWKRDGHTDPYGDDL